MTQRSTFFPLFPQEPWALGGTDSTALLDPGDGHVVLLARGWLKGASVTEPGPRALAPPFRWNVKEQTFSFHC